jgi:hypothetical protein
MKRPPRPHGLCGFRREIRIAGAAVNYDQAVVHAFEHAAGPKQRILDLGRPGDAQDDDVRRAGQVRCTPRLFGTHGDQVLHRSAVAMREHRQRKTLGEDVFRHPRPHQSEANEADVFLRAHVDRLPVRTSLRE